MIMEQKKVVVPFDLYLAKQIHGNNKEGRIITRTGGYVRNIVFNVKDENYPISAIIEVENDRELTASYTCNGCYRLNEKIKDPFDLMLEIPESLQFKPFDNVLVRQSETEKWECAIFSSYTRETESYRCNGIDWKYCIPYNEKTQRLVGYNGNL